MQITTGIFKGRNIFLPKGIRPTQNKVRKALFDILGGIEGLTFLELFSGSAAVGIEALSRGAAFLTLVENNRHCLSMIRKNLGQLGSAGYIIIENDAERAPEFFKKQKKEFDLIFLDPPYSYPVRGQQLTDSAAKKTLQNLSQYDILAPNGFIIVQHSRKDNLPDAQGGLILFKQYKYGDTLLSLYKKGQQ